MALLKELDLKEKMGEGDVTVTPVHVDTYIPCRNKNIVILLIED